MKSSKKGFSLIELLVTLSITGTLLTIGNITYSSYIRRARSQDAKQNLAVGYASQKKYRAACGHYFPDLNVIGAVPSGVIYYNLGSHFSGFTNSDDTYKCFSNSPDCSNLSSSACKSDLTSICGSEAEALKTDRNVPCAFESTKYSKDTKKYLSSLPLTEIQKTLGPSATTLNLSLKPNQLVMFSLSNMNGKCAESKKAECDVWIINGNAVINHVQNKL